MREYLLWWRDKPQSEKKQIMQDNNIKAIIYEYIKRLYLEGRK
jgi:hypothetical protein